MMLEGLTKQPPSLVELCVRIAIDNVRYIGYVGGVDFQLLDQIFQHCTLEQLIHIEDSTQVRNFSLHNKIFCMFLRFLSKSDDFSFLFFVFVCQDTDLSPVTNKFWKRFYKKQYGEENLNEVMEKMKRKKVNFKWRELYEVVFFFPSMLDVNTYVSFEILKIYAHGFAQAKSIRVQEKEKEVVERLKQRYKNEDESMIFTNLSSYYGRQIKS